MHKAYYKILALLMLLLSLTTLEAFAGEYDKYTTLLRNPKTPSTGSNIAKHFLVYPFEIIRWPMDKALVTTEKYALDTKTLWAYEKLVERGITPHYQSLSGSFVQSLFGAEVDFVNLFNQRQNVPDAVVKSWIDYAHDIYFGVGSQVGVNRMGDLPIHSFATVKYENRPQEKFYGIGPNSSAGDGTAYKMEETFIEGLIGANPTQFLTTDLKFAYQNINITEGEHDGAGIVDKQFFPRRIPGIAGDDILSTTLEIAHDTRNQKEDSNRGGKRSLGFGWHKGVNESDADYFKYRAEASQYFTLGSEKRVLAVRALGEHNAQTSDGYVPFYQMARLGGFGDNPTLTRTMRGYDDNRFYDRSALLGNLEYRYRIWQYREMKTDAVVFFDEGQVFGNFSKLKFSNFRESYGGGFRFALANHILFSVEIAHGDEGTNFYVRSNAPF